MSNPQLQEKMYLGYTISNFRYMQNLSPEFKNMTREQQLAVLPMAQLGIGNLADQLRTGKISKDAWGTPTTKFSEAVKRRQQESGLKPFGKNALGIDVSTETPKVSAAPTQTEVAQQRAASVSQPPPMQVASSVNVLPIDMSTSQQQSGGGGGQVVSTPPSQKNGPSVPLLPSSNPDNFLVLYSKIVYNVVDG